MGDGLSLVSLLLARAASHPDDPAIVEEQRTVHYGELGRRILSAAGGLHALGVRRGDTVAFSFGNSATHAIDFVSAIYGAGYLGAAVLPLYPDVLVERQRELVGVFGARWSVAAVAQDLGATALMLGDACASSRTEPPPGCEATLPFFYQFSSGTTGVPKVVLFSHQQFLALGASLVGHYGWKSSDRFLPALRAPTKVGLRYLFRVLMVGGALLNVPFPGSRRELAETIAALGANAAGASPWQLRRLLASPPATVPTPPLRFLESIGAPIAAHEIQAIRRDITPNLHVNYASSESGLVATLGPDDPVDGGYALVKDVTVQIVDEADRPLPAEAVGAIRISVPWLPQGYARNEAETAKRFRGGWFHPGDAGALDARGRLKPLGRSDSAINFGGAKILPEEVETVLLRHPQIDDAGVTGLAEPMAGEVAVALVVARHPLTQEALRSFCLAQLDAWSVPAGFLFVERLPRAADGKLNRAQLKDLARSLAHIAHSTKP
jgi:long-chain acyl-CoA synthetase